MVSAGSPKMSRRQVVKLGLAATSVALVGTDGALIAAETAPVAPARGRSNADESLRGLLAGNDRFASGQLVHPARSPEDFRGVAAAQYPLAVVVGCSDSRVAPEIVFDVGVGDLFVVRVAGNIVSGAGATVKGSIEYALAELNVPLIMVLGHSSCGAVKSAVKHADAKDQLPGAIADLVELIKPAVLKSKEMAGDALDNAIRANVALGVERLKTLEPIVAPRVRNGTVKVAGAVYDLGSGKVTMLSS